MKNKSSFFLILAIFGAITVSCRKGENDPFFSIRTRDSRLVGVWDIKGVYNKTVTTELKVLGTEEPYTKLITYDSDTLTTVDGKNEYFDYYVEKLTINENGTFVDSIKMKRRNTKTLKVYVVQNSWYWLDSKKNKSAVNLVGYGIFDVNRLAWKELVLTQEEETQDPTQIVSKSVKLTFKREL